MIRGRFDIYRTVAHTRRAVIALPAVLTYVSTLTVGRCSPTQATSIRPSIVTS